jgi:hypothetical protein
LGQRGLPQSQAMWLDYAMANPGSPAKKSVRLRPAGFEHCVRRGSAILELGFNTEGQAQIWADTHGLKEGTYSIERRDCRRVGTGREAFREDP